MLNKFKNLKKINLLKLFKLGQFEKRVIFFLIIIIFIAVNLLLSSFAYRYDASYGKAYTLSTSTKNVLKKLDGTVTIKFYVSSNLPTRIIPIKTEVIDFLNEYKKTSSKINLKVIDPKKDSNAQQEVKDTGIPELQFSQLESDKYAVSSVYFGILISYNDKKEVIPQIADLNNFEYDLTSLIYKLTNKELAKIGIVGKEDIIDPRQDDLLTFKRAVSQQFDIGYTKIDNSLKTLMIFDDNKKNYSEDEVNQIKNYLNNGGKAIFFIDGVWVNTNQGLSTNQAQHNLFNLLNDWGVTLNKDLALSTSSELVNFGNGMVSFFSPYPFWVKTNIFNESSSFFSNIQALTFPWASSLTLNKKAGLNVSTLVKTTKKSWEQKDKFVLDPNSIPNPGASNLKELTLVADVKDKKGGEILVIPSSRFISENMLRQNGNLEFVLNALNNMASNGALTGIRARQISSYPLPDLQDNQKDMFKYLNILLLPALLALYAGMRLVKRK